MSIDSVMSSNHLIVLCRPLFLLPSVLPSNKVLSSESALHIRWSKHWSFSFTISPSSAFPQLSAHPFFHSKRRRGMKNSLSVGRDGNTQNLFSGRCGSWWKGAEHRAWWPLDDRSTWQFSASTLGVHWSSRWSPQTCPLLSRRCPRWITPQEVFSTMTCLTFGPKCPLLWGVLCPRHYKMFSSICDLCTLDVCFLFWGWFSFWLPCMAYGALPCMISVPEPGTEPTAVKVWNPNHCTNGDTSLHSRC